MTNLPPLVLAAENGNLQEVTRLLDSGVDINERDIAGQTALFMASYNGHLAIATLLLDRGASMNIRQNSGYTALMTASYHNRANIVSLLLERGANPSIINRYGKTALDFARERYTSNCVDILEKYEHFHQFRANWLSLAIALSTFQEDQHQNQEPTVSQSHIQGLALSPSLRRVMDSSDLVRYVTEFM